MSQDDFTELKRYWLNENPKRRMIQKHKAYFLFLCLLGSLTLLILYSEPIKQNIERKYIKKHHNFTKKDAHVITELLKFKKSLSKLLATTWKKDVGYTIGTINKDIKAILQSLNLNSNISRKTESQPNKILDVCREMYKGYDYAIMEQFQRGWILAKCNKTNSKMEDLVTIILNFAEHSENEVKRISSRVIRGIGKSHVGINILVGVPYGSKFNASDFPQNVNITLVPFKKTNSGKIWNDLVSLVQTKYVLIGNGLTHYYGDDARLHRLLYEVQFETKVIAVGSSRNLTGHWSLACYQMAFRNYQLKLQYGYDFSLRECIFCDVITGPFMTKTKTLLEYKFDETLEHSNLVFMDFFIQNRNEQLYTKVCSDSMFHVRDNSLPNSWEPLALQHEITDLYLPNSKVKTFSCSEIGISCKNFLPSIAKPSCCLQEMAKEIQRLDSIFKVCEKTYEVHNGTVLGIIKFGEILPWETRADLWYHEEDLEELREEFRDQRFQVCEHDYKNSKYFIRMLNEMFIRVSDNKILDTDKLKKQGKLGTKIQMSNYWVNSSRNPGSYIRNRYGADVYKNRQYWKEDNSGWFTECEKPISSACLNQFYKDGNIQFAKPV